MPIVYGFQCTVEYYRDHFEELDIPRPGECPHCQAVDSVIGHGSHWRKPLDRWKDYLIRIKRWLCKACGHAVSILPSFLLRFRRYVLAVIGQVVTARFEDDASWGQIEQQRPTEALGLSPVEGNDDCVPSERTIRRWCRSLDEQAPRWLAAVQRVLADHDVTLPLLDPLGEATVARTAAGALLHGATQLLAWAKTEGELRCEGAVVVDGKPLGVPNFLQQTTTMAVDGQIGGADIAVRAMGNEFTVMRGDEVVGRMTDDRFPSGGAGFIVDGRW